MASQGRKRREDGAKPRQDVQTPPEFLGAVRARFGTICLDLAANARNHVCGNWLGPGSVIDEDALSVSWNYLAATYAPRGGGCVWLNPPFRDAEPWLARAQQYSANAQLLVLLPASIGSLWFRDRVLTPKRCIVHALNPRLTFVGETKPYPKDLMLLQYGAEALDRLYDGREQQLQFWRWKS